MSSPATSTFLDYWRRRVRQPVTLARIVFTVPSALTVRVATTSLTIGTTVYEAGMSCSPIRSRLARLGTGPDPADCTIRIAKRAFAGLAASAEVALSTWKWQGAAVTLYLWNDVRSPASGAQLLADADKLQVFDGVVDSYALDESAITLNLLQPRSYNKPIPTRSVDRISYPNAPDASQGRPVPIVYGDHVAFPLRAPFASGYGADKQRQEESGAGLGVVPMLLVDPGLAAANVKLVAASHACVKISDRANGYSQFVGADDVVAPIDTAGITETLGATESYVTINDDTLVAYCGIRPVDARGTYNTALNARRATDPFDERTYATLQQAANGVLELQLPSVGSLGYIEAVDVLVAFVGNASNTHALRVSATVPGGTPTAALTTTLGESQTTTPLIKTATWPSGFWNQSWQFGGASTGSPWDIKVDFTGGTTNKARILWVVLRVKYRPQRNLVTPAFISGGFFAGAPVPPQWQNGPGTPVGQPYYLGGGSTFYPALLDVQGDFFANLKGYADDVSGTYTGSASALIARACDIARHLLAVYGGETSFETGATAFGSFVLARSLLRNAAPSDFKLAAWIGEQTSVQRTLQQVAQQALLAIYRDRFTGKWLCHAWKRGANVDYDLTLEPSHLAAIEAGISSDVELAQGIRVAWGYDHYKNRALFESFVNATGSSQGYVYPTQRDQKLTVTAGVNDRFDWYAHTTVDTATFNDTLTPGDLTPSELADQLQTLIRSHFTAYWIRAGYGFTIEAGVNDNAEFRINSVDYTATLAPGSYTAEGLCREAHAKMVAAAGVAADVIAVVYDHATNKFTFSTTHPGGGGLKSTASASTPGTLSWWTFGFRNGGTMPATSNFEAYAERLWIRTDGNCTINVLFGTGANAATSCAMLAGYAGTDTGLVQNAVAGNSRGTREALCAASQESYGPRADAVVSAPWVRDESSAQQLRDRIFDFGSEPTAWVRVRTHATPDLQRFRVVRFSDEVDARLPFPKYGGGATWEGRVFRVLEVQQDLGPSYHVEFYAEEA